MKLKIGDVIETYFNETATIIDIFYDKRVRDEKAYVLDKTITVKNSKEPYGNPNRECFIFRKDFAIETSDIKTTIKRVLEVEDVKDK